MLVGTSNNYSQFMDKEAKEEKIFYYVLLLKTKFAQVKMRKMRRNKNQKTIRIL
jgi:hypothetical protein